MWLHETIGNSSCGVASITLVIGDWLEWAALLSHSRHAFGVPRASDERRDATLSCLSRSRGLLKFSEFSQALPVNEMSCTNKTTG